LFDGAIDELATRLLRCTARAVLPLRKRAPLTLSAGHYLFVRHSTLVNYLLYQAGWFACMLGAAWQWPLTGFGLAVAGA